MDFIKSIFAKKNTAPDHIKIKFKQLFPKAIGVEWCKLKDNMEAVFTEEGTEKISLFSREGNLIELKTNLSIEAIPNTIAKAVEQEGEIMNCISIFIPEVLNYELIVRDSNLKRYRISSDKNGSILSKVEL